MRAPDSPRAGARGHRRCVEPCDRHWMLHIFSNDSDGHVVETVDLAEQDITLHNGTDVLGRAAVDDVARLELKRLRQLRDLFCDVPDHLREIRVLTYLAVDGQGDPPPLQVPDASRRMYRAEYRRMIEALADFPRPLFHGHGVLKIAPCHVETNRIAMHVRESI